MAEDGMEIQLGDRARRRPRRLGLTALTDLVFILLLFFILETRFVTFHQLEFRQPRDGHLEQPEGGGERGENQPDPEPLRLQVFADGRIWIGGDVVAMGEFAAYLRERNPAPETLVVVAVEAAAPAQVLVTALDSLHGARLDKVLVRQFEPAHD
ncbi:MAG: hypothetical protein AMXMBFR26_18190 [Porticoccaceae bacterium]